LRFFIRRSIREPTRCKAYAEVSRGIASGIWNYKLGIESAEGSWFRKYNLLVDLSIYRLTDMLDVDIMPSDGEQLAMSFLFGNDLRDYYQRDGTEMSLSWQPTNPWQLILKLRDERHSSLSKHSNWSLFSREEKRENPPITKGKLRSICFVSGFHPGREDKCWISAFTVEHASRSLGSDFDFTMAKILIRGSLSLPKNFFSNLRVKAGISNGSLPIQRRFFIGGPGTLRGYRFKEFSGDDLVLVNLEYGRRIVGGIRWVFFTDIGCVWGYRSGMNLNSDVKLSIGAGILIGGFRMNLAQALERRRKPVFNFRFSRTL